MSEKTTVTVTGGTLVDASTVNDLLVEADSTITRFGRPFVEAVNLINSFMVTKSVRFNPVILAGVPYVLNRKVVTRLLELARQPLPDAELIAVFRDIWSSGYDPDGTYSTIAVGVSKPGFSEAELPMSQMVPPTGVDFLVPGLCAGAMFLIGNTGAGKTTFLNKALKPDAILRWGEPSEDVDIQDNVIHTRTYADTVMLAVFLTCMGARVAIDSIRVVAYGMRSQAGAKGVAARLPLEGTAISLAFSRAKGVGVVALNPLLEEDATTFLVSQLASSATGAIHLRDAGNIVSETYRTVTGRLFSKRSELGEKTVLSAVEGLSAIRRVSTPIELDVAKAAGSVSTETAWQAAGRPMNDLPAKAAESASDVRVGTFVSLTLNADHEI